VTDGSFAAVDLGASSGRVILGRVGPNAIEIQEVHRFPNEPVTLPDGLHWDVLRLYREVLDGLRLAGRLADDLVGIGIDSWGVDYGLLDWDGALLGNPFHYRDTRTEAAVGAVHRVVSRERLYARTGIQFLPIDTVYQLAAARATPQFEAARTFLMIPDLTAYWLTGVASNEETNASTTALFDVRQRGWATDLLTELGLPAALFPPTRRPGETLGPLRPEAASETGLREGTLVTLVGSHDTASAVVGLPAAVDDFAYIACGTWSLVGVELRDPLLDEASRIANFTNELGVDGRIRFLRNVMGLWILQESLREWERAGDAPGLAGLIEAAAELPGGGPLVDPDDPSLLPPGDMTVRIGELCRRTDQPPPASRPAMVRCILDSLAAAYARAVGDAVRLSGRSVSVVHLVGGGSRNGLLCQLTADACGLPVVAGPVEATALGNLLVQARATGLISGDLEALRALVRTTSQLQRHEPRTIAEGGAS
jgi:rhamnulokinase